MRFLRIFVSILSVVAISALAASAATLTVKVVDPQSAAVADAQVELLGSHASAVSVATTSGEGVALFHNISSGDYRVRVLAAGFAEETMPATSSSEILTVHLQLAPASETVVVTATRSAGPSDESGASVSSLNGAQLQVMNPVSTDDALHFLSGAIISTSGQRGGIASLFVRGGDSTYNKVIVDGVTVDQPGGTIDLGNLSLTEADHLEFMRGAQSTLYGSDAMTSVVQVWTRTGSTKVPELRFGADGGNQGTANGYASLAGANGRFDYNLFGNQFNTEGQGINDAYSDSLQGANVGVAFNDRVGLRIRVRHSNSHTGIPGAWDFNGQPLLPPDPSEWSQLNDLIGSAELTISAPSGWQHRLTAFDYSYQYTELNVNGDAARIDDFSSNEVDHINRVGFEYQGNYLERSWAQTIIGYRIENENGFLGDTNFPPPTHGQRLNNDVYAQQQIVWRRFSAIFGGRFVHNSAFGNTGVPRVALTLLALRGGKIFSGTRLRGTFATGFKEPGLTQTFAGPPFFVANPGLRPERNRAIEAGIQQNFFLNRYSLSATYFNNHFSDQIEFASDPVTFIGQYFNVNRSLAHGAEIELEGKILSRLLLTSNYTYLSTEILQAPLCTPANFCDPTFDAGNPFLRRPKHSGSVLLNYLGNRWGGNLGASFVGRRTDSDFLGLGIDHAAGYARVDLGGWYAVNPHVTAYVNVENALDHAYNEVVGYPALGINVRAGMRFRLGGE